MGGVVAGSAILKNRVASRELSILTVTVNNACNLSCPHCYLQYDGSRDVISNQVVDQIFGSKSLPKHIAIVGMEPLLNVASIRATTEIASRAKSLGISVSVITNGLTLDKVPDDLLYVLDEVDISLDGGRETYQAYRGGDLRKVEAGIRRASNVPSLTLNALNTISTANASFIDDMMAFVGDCPFDRVMFSPFVTTESQGIQRVRAVPVERILELLSNSSTFRSDSRAFLLVDNYHCRIERVSIARVKQFVERWALVGKVTILDEDPTRLGVLRVTYDGLVLSSFEALHTSWYASVARTLQNGDDLATHLERCIDAERRLLLLRAA